MYFKQIKDNSQPQIANYLQEAASTVKTPQKHGGKKL